ncbi:MAG: farnesyl diphosphate synthase [Pseudomonadota bacterium]
MNVKSFLDETRVLTEKALEWALDSFTSSPRLQEAMKYSLMAGGKRIRPALVFAACEAVGGNRKNALPIAVGLEMIHTYSLIHDDLPAMDDDDLRRGRPTSHKVFGEALAILAGDALLTDAFTVLSDPEWKIPAEDRVRIVHAIADGAGANGMVAGQHLDLEGEGKTLDEAGLKKVHMHKTGKLLVASVLVGGIAGGASKADMERLERYGTAIGLAFQIADDLLDLTATAEELGKPVRNDAERRKSTYPTLLGIDEAKRRAQKLLSEALAALEPFGSKGEALAALARFIVERRS